VFFYILKVLIVSLKPHRCGLHKVRTVATVVARSVCLLVCRLRLTTLSCAKTDELIEMPFGMWTPDVELSDWVAGSLGHFGSSFTPGSPGHRVIILTLCQTRAFFRFLKKCPKCKQRTFEMLK